MGTSQSQDHCRHAPAHKVVYPSVPQGCSLVNAATCSNKTVGDTRFWCDLIKAPHEIADMSEWRKNGVKPDQKIDFVTFSTLFESEPERLNEVFIKYEFDGKSCLWCIITYTQNSA